MTSHCSILVEDAFGPVVADSCLQGFDFTLLFEETILTILPLGIAVLWALVYILFPRDTTIKVRKSWMLSLKQSAYMIYSILQVPLLVLWIDDNVPRTRATIATVALTFASFIFFQYVSYLEHVLLVRPSTLLTVYLSISSLLDLARVRTLFFVADSQIVARIFLGAYCVKIGILILEIVEKRSLLLPRSKGSSREATSGVLNRALFIWLNDLFWKGFGTHLTFDILTPLDADILSASKPTSLIARWERADKSSQDALLQTFVVHYRWNLLAGVLPRLAYTGFTFAQPFLVQRVLDYVAEPARPNTKNIAYGLIGAFAIVYIGLSISFSVFQHKTYRVLTMFRGSLIALIFGKTLCMSSTTMSDAEAVTLVTADIERIGTSIDMIHEIYASFLEVGLALWLLYRLLGVAVSAPAAYIVVCLFVGLPIANLAGNAQVPWLEAIERRLAATAKFLGVMKAVKMTGLTESVASTVRVLRSSEIRASRRFRILNVGVTLSSFLSSTIAPVLGFGLYILLARAHNTETLTEGTAFAALSLFELLDQPLMYIVDGVEQLQTIINSFRRIQEYLMTEERKDTRMLPESMKSSRASVYGQQSQSEEIALKELARFSVDDQDELHPAFVVKGATAEYSSEDKPILENLDFDIAYGQTTMVIGPVGCGKSTLIRLLLGEMPETSGLVWTKFAEAAYCPQTPWITWGTIRENIRGECSWDKPWYDAVVKACALSIDFEAFPDGDQTRTGTQGSRLSGGQQMRVSLARALYARASVVFLDDVFAGLDRATERSVLDAVLGADGLLRQYKSTVIMATSSADHLPYADRIIAFDEAGEISQVDTMAFLRDNNEYIQRLALRPAIRPSQPQLEIPEEILQELDLPENDDMHGIDRRTGDLKVYAYYIRIAGWGVMSIYLFSCMSFVFGVTFPTVWLQMWTNANAVHPNEDIGYWLGVYGALAAITLLGCLATDAVFNLSVVPRVSWRMHELLLTTTMSATTSFLTTTDAGKTINRFSQDLDLIDNDLPRNIDQTLFQFLSAIAAAVLIFIGSGYLAAAIPLCLFLLYLIQSYYLRTSRQLRLLEIEAKAPLLSNFLETLSGLASIRAYGWTDAYMERNHKILNTSQKPYYLLRCIQRWLTLVLDLLVAGIAILLVALATNVSSGSTSFLGVAFYSVVSFSITLQQLVTEWTQLEMSLGAINRVRSYVSNTVHEDLVGESDELPPDWPRNGAIKFCDVSASYQSSLEPVLKHVNFSIGPGEKIALCGRTGSGKSSLISTLLRMLELEGGKIVIDDVDISKISRQELRKRINTLPQEPFFLHGTVRYNIDPLQIASDEEIIMALRTVGLWDLLEPRAGLDRDLNEEMLSHGQRQLFCLARVIVGPNSFLIMDEATSSVDAHTDELMQRIIRDNFSGRTIIAIAHKLETVLDFDRVVLLDNGSIVESGNPQELLTTPNSLFRKLYESKTHNIDG